MTSVSAMEAGSGPHRGARERFENEGYVVLPPGAIFSDADISQLLDAASAGLPAWDSGAVDPKTNDSHNDPRFGVSMTIGDATVEGVALRHRFQRGRGSIERELDDNFLYGKRATLDERHWPRPLFGAAENPRLLREVAEARGATALTFRAGAATAVYPAYTGPSRQWRIDTPLHLKTPTDAHPESAFLVNAIVLLEDCDEALAPARVIPGSHRRRPEINAKIAGHFRRPATDNMLDAFAWEELLPADLERPVSLTGKRGTVFLLHSDLLRGPVENTTADRTAKALWMSYSARADTVFNRRDLSTDRAGCRRVLSGFRDRSLVEDSFGQGARLLSPMHRTSVGERIREFLREGWKKPLRPRYYALQRAEMRLKNRPLETKRYLNIGAGVGWRHPDVVCLDFALPNAEVAMNLNHRVPLPFSDSRFEGAYVSHCLEHLKESLVKWWASEALRVLKKGGVFRVTSPNIAAFLDAYDARDASFYPWIRGRGAYLYDSWLRLIVRMFAEPTVDRYSDEELYAMYAQLGREAFVARLDAEVEAVTDERYLDPSCHKSWWSGEKMRDLLLQTGFSSATITTQNESGCEVFTQKRFFNRTRPYMSFFVEGVK